MATASPVPLQQWEVLNLLGDSAAMQSLHKDICTYAAMSVPILITGEPGAGKEQVAKACHVLSKRGGTVFNPLNCSALSESLLESELFGHEAGSFTGANKLRIGRFEATTGGTIFLDEIGTLPLSTQVRLLRVLQEGTIERVGGNDTIKVDVRVIAATNEPLFRAMDQNRFRRDLYGRLSYLLISVPPLRDRERDVLLLADHILGKACETEGLTARLDDSARTKLLAHRWPGNVRELQAVISRALASSTHNGGLIQASQITFDSGHDPKAIHCANEVSAPADVRDAIAARTLDLLLAGIPPLEGLKRGSVSVGGLLKNVVEGVALGVHQYIDTDAGERKLRNLSVTGLMIQMGLSAHSGSKSQLARAFSGAIRDVLAAKEAEDR